MHLGPTLRGFGRDSEELRGKRLDRGLVRRVLGFARPYRKLLGTFIAPMSTFLGAINAMLATPANMADALAREKSKATEA